MAGNLFLSSQTFMNIREKKSPYINRQTCWFIDIRQTELCFVLCLKRLKTIKKSERPTGRRRIYEYYYCQICNKDSFSFYKANYRKSLKISPAMVGHHQSLLKVLTPCRATSGQGRLLNYFFDVFQRWKKLLWQPKLYCKFFVCSDCRRLVNYSLC